ncbi:MAG: single-stranded DNA-binding protein [Candidatus Pacebacteria bacterium]|nr:single-stranded DNA-binding protein [Candidatus Paceibacterota bacterium]
MNLNKVFVLGRITADPQIRSTPTGMQVGNFSVATNRVWTDKSGARKEHVEFHSVVVWGKQAEIASQFLKKGALILVEGRLQTRSWDDKAGQKRKTTEIICERLQMGPRPLGAQRDAGASQDKVESVPTIDIGEEIKEEEIKPEDLPF